MDILTIAYKEAVSFSGLQPPKEAKEIGRQQTDADTYIYYQDEDNRLWYTSLSQLAFEKMMSEHEKRTDQKSVPMV